MKKCILKNTSTGTQEKVCIKVCKIGIPANSNNYSIFILSNNIDLDGFPANNNDKENYEYSYVVSDLYMSFEKANLKFKKIISKSYPFGSFKGKYTVVIPKSKFEEIKL